jgi:hypothetical protein
MSIHPEREPYIPVRVADLIEVLCHDRGPGHANPLSDSDQISFRKFADLAISRNHAECLDQLRRLKNDYAPFDPDNDLHGIDPDSNAEANSKLTDLFEQFADLLHQADFKRLTRDELEQIMFGASDWGVDMHVPWDAYDQVDVYVRGFGPGRRTLRKWYRFFRIQDVFVPAYARVVLILKQRAHKSLEPQADTKHVFMKLFKDIPTMDLEMLLPGTRIKMPKLDRLRLGGTGLGTLGYMLFKLQTMMAPLLKAIGLVTTGAFFGDEGLLGLIALYTPLALIFGYAYRTYASFNTTKRSYQLQLSQSLYFQNLDNNAGVLHRLLDEAEEQESREVLLGYFFLWRYAGPNGWTAEELDQYVELELGRMIGRDVDFDVDEALKKLEQASLIVRDGARWIAVPIEQTVR